MAPPRLNPSSLRERQRWPFMNWAISLTFSTAWMKSASCIIPATCRISIRCRYIFVNTAPPIFGKPFDLLKNMNSTSFLLCPEKGLCQKIPSEFRKLTDNVVNGLTTGSRQSFVFRSHELQEFLAFLLHPPKAFFAKIEPS